MGALVDRFGAGSSGTPLRIALRNIAGTNSCCRATQCLHWNASVSTRKASRVRRSLRLL
ncbi:hypothetical protein [Lysobacter gummosus]|uniref:hypothetical protein n=1 Tax=Lysobacter gummosus TaxID=262324 RepID=UPI003645311D